MNLTDNTQDFTGKLVLIPRGVCEFSVKTLLAQQQGAVGVIIQNFQEGTVGMAPGTVGDQVLIPVVMVSKSVGEAIAAAVQQGETVTAAFLSGPYHFGRIMGRVAGDLNADCTAQMDEPGLRNWLVTAEGSGQTYQARTRTDGSYSLFADSSYSPFTVSVQPYNALWEICPPASATVAIAGQDTVRADFFARPVLHCPQLSAAIGTPFLRRCFENWFQVEVCNSGSQVAENAYVVIHLDAPGFEPIQNASLPYTLEANGDYRFELNDLGIGDCAHFQFSAVVSCDSNSIGQIRCYSAHAYPDTFCILPGQDWSGAQVTVTGTCLAGNPQFRLQNTGVAAMFQSAAFLVLRNGELYQSGQFQLAAGQIQLVNLPGDGATWRVEASQEPNHPIAGTPSATLEGCTGWSNFDTGFALQFSVYDSREAVDEECQEVIGAWDPNDKQGFPLGVGGEHLILPNTDLDYRIRFQNTGTDTAFNVVVRDTLSPFFAAGSIRPGVASAAYDFELENENVLVFRFRNIKLVDSFTNEAASHGFVRFQIRQQPNLAWGTALFNSAAIYFDFNPAVITNTTYHLLGDVPHVLATTDVSGARPSLLHVFPNPAHQVAEISLDEPLPDGTVWRLLETSGKNLDAGIVHNNRLKINQPKLPAGVYWIDFSRHGQRLGLAKWVVQ